MVDDPLARRQIKTRWRLVLGEGCEDAFGDDPLDDTARQQDQALSFLYGREYQRRGRNVRERRGAGLCDSQLSVPEWINAVHQLFPQETIERLEKDALERYQIDEMVTNPELLRRARPSLSLLKAILQTKHLMNEQVLQLARELARKVIDQLLESLARTVSSPFLGAVNRRRRSYLKVAKNFDALQTIRRNLKHWDPETERLLIQEPIFFSRVRRRSEQWQLIILVDQSGSMADSVIYSAVSAAIFCGIRALRTHLVVFDTNIVDLTDRIGDPVETLMKVQLGGGTDIGHALAYGASLVEQPRKTILLLITDFYEGGSPQRLIDLTRELVESGVHMLGLGALDERAKPIYDRSLAQRLANVGADIGAMTPGELAAWVAEKVNG